MFSLDESPKIHYMQAFKGFMGPWMREIYLFFMRANASTIEGTLEKRIVLGYVLLFGESNGAPCGLRVLIWGTR